MSHTAPGWLLPSPDFSRAPLQARWRRSERMLDALDRMLSEHLAMKPEYQGLRDLIAWTGIRHDLEAARDVWLHERRKCISRGMGGSR